MGNVTNSSQNNITSPNGNSLAFFVEGTIGVMKVKDVLGNIQPYLTLLVVVVVVVVEVVHLSMMQTEMA